jgi:20S proteasome alpha/beta subunit
MTYILASRCNDGVALVADKKIVYDESRIDYRDKLIIIDVSIVLGASGVIGLFDTFREYAHDIVKEYRQTNDVKELIRQIQETTRRVNQEKKYLTHSAEFDLVVAAKTDHFRTLKLL